MVTPCHASPFGNVTARLFATIPRYARRDTNQKEQNTENLSHLVLVSNTCAIADMSAWVLIKSEMRTIS